MKTKDIRNAGIIAVAAGFVLVPLVKYVARRLKAANAAAQPAKVNTSLFSAYMGKHNPHHRKAQQDGRHLQN